MTDVEKGDPNTVTERIEFTQNWNIDRRLPEVLSDNGKMSLMIWEQFCDKIDKEIKPLQRITAVVGCMWIVFIICLCIASSAHRYADDSVQYAIQAIAGLGGLHALWIVSRYKKRIRKRVQAKVDDICAMHSNHDKDLTLRLNASSKKLYWWFIMVTLRNVNVGADAYVEGKPIEDLHPADKPKDDKPAAGPVGGPAPKKYVKDPKGNLALNPEYKAWKMANPRTEA